MASQFHRKIIVLSFELLAVNLQRAKLETENKDPTLPFHAKTLNETDKQQIFEEKIGK